ncbi:MAG: hypothetical protein EBU66_16350 [Bacteroidetes bacterium]|nr:hypothetical protein [bacterium]NBP66208.1 hypothetical protein [Bacteroidota bacterium]
MMTQKATIYIILSAILLYLYYRKRDLAIFAGFVVVVVGTLILGKGRDIEGNTGRRSGNKGSGSGGDYCSSLNFADPTIDKTRVVTSLIELNDNFKKVCGKYVSFEGRGPELNTEGRAILKPLFEDEQIKKKLDSKIKNFQNENQETYFAYMIGTRSLLLNNYTETDKGELRFIVFGSDQPVKKTLNDFTKDDYKFFKSAISCAKALVTTIDEIMNLEEIKEQDKKTKDFFKFMKCAVNHTIKVLNNLKEALPPYVDPNPKPKSEGDTNDKKSE